MNEFEDAASPEALAELVQEFVNQVSHTQGRTLAALAGAGVTLPQVLLLKRIAARGASTPSELAGQMHMSLPSLSQMVDRLFRLQLVSRTESADDRRRTRLAVTLGGRALLRQVAKARSADYAAGLALLSP
ncbi:MAG TPA: MarR family transcriptional regulator, partial [Steroidobacteraceae bacterium]|nr:MarR family transcriptional regulator [Steroidobacteraceae bacterium]